MILISRKALHFDGFRSSLAPEGEKNEKFGLDRDLRPLIEMPPSGEKRKQSESETKPLFGSEGDGWSGSRRRKRKKEGGRKLPVGSKAEVRQFDAGLRGSWYTGIVVGYEKSSRTIEYDHLLAEDDSSKLIETVCVSPILEGLDDCENPICLRGHIRPSPPVFACGELALCYGLCVDAFINDAWWEGVIFDHQEYLVERLVFFPDQGDQHRVNVIRLRITQDWDESSGEWRCRGNWRFLEILEKFVLEGSLPVSVRQIWYDLRTSVGFKHGILEWTHGERSLWNKLVFEAVKENMNAALGLACTLKEVAAEGLTIQKSDEGSKVSQLQSYACGEDNGNQTHVCDEQRFCEDILQMTLKHAAEDSTVLRKLHSSVDVEDTGKQTQVCNQQRLTGNILQLIVEHVDVAEDETIQMDKEGREVRKLQLSACGETNEICDQQNSIENMLQMTVKHTAEDSTVRQSIDGRKDDELESSPENILQMTVEHADDEENIQMDGGGTEVRKLRLSACGEDSEIQDQPRFTEKMLQMTIKHAAEDLTIQKGVDGRKGGQLESSPCDQDTGKQTQVCDWQGSTENMFQMTATLTAEDSTIQESEEERGQSFACGESTGKQKSVCNQQKLTENMIQMTVRRATDDSTIQDNEEGKKVKKLASSACADDISKQPMVCDEKRSTEDMLQMTGKHAAEDVSIQKSEEGRERKPEPSECREDAGKQLHVCSHQIWTGNMVQMTVTNAAEDSTIQESEERREISELQSSGFGEDSEKQTQSCDWPKFTENLFQTNVAVTKHAVDFKPTDGIVLLENDLQLEEITNPSQEGGNVSDFQSAGGKDAGNMVQMTVKNVAEGLTIKESEEGREISDLQCSGCGEDTEKQIQICYQQKLTENMFQMNVASVKHAIILKPVDTIVVLEKDLQPEQITNPSQESGNASDFQYSGGRDEELKAIRRGNKQRWVSKKRTCLGSAHNKPSSMRKDLQAMSDFLLGCQHDALGRTRSKVLSEAKQILLASGWVFGTNRSDSHPFYYISPGGQRFHSFAQACKAWQEEQEADMDQSSMDDEADGDWKPWGMELQPKYSPQAVKDYFTIYLEKKGVSKTVLMHTKLHLLALGWKILQKERTPRDCKEHAIRLRTRYISPLGEKHSHLIKACTYLMQQDGKMRTKNSNENASELNPKSNAVSNGHCQHFSQPENLKLGNDKDFSVLELLEGSEDSRKAIEEDKRVQRSANDYLIGDKVQHEQSDLSQDLVECVRQADGENLCEEQASSALDNQDCTLDGRRCMDASPSSTNLVVVTEGGSNSDTQKYLSPDVLVEQQDGECNYSPLCQNNFMMYAKYTDPQIVPSNVITATGGGSNTNVQTGLLQKIPAEQQDSEGNYSPLCRENFIMHTKQNDPQVRVQCNKLGLMKRKSGKVQTVLAWLVDNSVVLPKQKVYYRSNEGHHVMAEGRITQEGIKCSCCKKVYGLAQFSVHAGGTVDKPTANIFLKNGKSLLQCQTQLVLSKKMKFLKPYQHRRVKGDHDSCKSDNICSVCHYGGELILCDYCPSSFHFSCIGLKGVPEGTWSCSSCQCGICSRSEYDADIDQFTEETILYCDQCECQYHVGCLRKTRLPNLESCPEGSWFCSESCSQIFAHLQKLTGKTKPTVVKGLSWTILRSRREDSHDIDIDTMVVHHSKLWVALNVLHECFQPFIEPHTKSDFFTNVVFNRRSKLKRLNFQGFYTVILEREEEVISVAAVRIFGEKVAEVPLIGTRVQYRRMGMCRFLMNEIEKVLCNLGIKKLLLPAVPEMLATWINSFGFTKMTIPARLKFLEFTFLDFEETAMCEKQLLQCARTRTLDPKEDIAQDSSHKTNEAVDCDRVNSFSEVINPRIPLIDTQEHLLNDKVGICEEPSVHVWDSNYRAGPVLLADNCAQTNQNKMLPSVAGNISGINGNNTCGLAPPVDMEKKHANLSLKSYLTRTATRQRAAQTAG